MINAVPFVGWAMSFGFSVSLAIPFWICWTLCGIGARYFYFAPAVYQCIPFWHCVGLFIVMSILRGLFPVLVSVSQTNKQKNEPTETHTIGINPKGYFRKQSE